VTLLLIDAAGTLQAVFPSPGREGDARIPIGKSLRTPRAVVEAAQQGVEHLLLLAVAAEGAPQTFAWVADTSAVQHASQVMATRGNHSSRDALREILRGSETTRGAALNELTIQKLSWRVIP
jgi:hypothetical protein